VPLETTWTTTTNINAVTDTDRRHQSGGSGDELRGYDAPKNPGLVG